MKTLNSRVRKKQSQITGKRMSYSEAFKNEDGAIDLASIMVGIIVIGLIGGVIAATVFAVIPWTQDNAAKQQLDSIASAESAYMGMSSAVPSPLNAGYVPNSFGNSAQLAAAKLLSVSEAKTYCAVTTADGKSYTGYSKSASGSVWSITDKNTKPVLSTDPVPAECGFTADGASAPTPAPPTPTQTPTPTPEPYVDPTPSLTTLTYKCDTTVSNANIPMNGSLTGTEKWSDGLTRTYSNVANGTVRNFTAGVTYKVTFDGTYTSMNSYSGSASAIAPCLRSVDYWGAGTGVTNGTQAFYMTSNLTDVPSRIPTTITNMTNFLREASQINDPDISAWDVSNVTDMGAMFNGATNFNQPLNSWNVSKVTNLSGMFNSATNFNGDITGWNIQATSMSSMFSGAKAFNQPIGNWNTSNVTSFLSMFTGATSFNQDISAWNTSNVTSLSNMFGGASAFNQPLNSWDTTKVTNMNQVFANTPFNQPLDNWKTANVTNMVNMFYNNKVFNQPLNTWDTSNVTSMADMFGLNSAFNQDLSSWNTAKVTNMSRMFYGASAFNQPLNTFVTTNVTDMNSMFRGASAFNQPLNTWNTANVTNMSQMFRGASAFNQPLNSFVTTKVTTMFYMFDGATSFNQPLNTWNTSNVTDMSYMFQNATVFNQYIKGWTVTKVTASTNFRTGSALTTTNSPF